MSVKNRASKPYTQQHSLLMLCIGCVCVCGCVYAVSIESHKRAAVARYAHDMRVVLIARTFNIGCTCVLIVCAKLHI